VTNQFDPDKFHAFCNVYVDAFHSTFKVVATQLQRVFYPSSVFVEETPPNMGEYAAAKAAAETLCHFLSSTHREIRFHIPRYPRLATDQTASLIAVDTGDAKTVVISSLRELRQEAPRHSKPRPASLAKPVTKGLAFTVAATFTAEPIEPALRFWMSEIRQTGPVEFAQFNQVFQALLEPAGLMSRKNFANAVLIRLEDWIEDDRSALDPAAWKSRLQPVTDEFVTAASAMPRPAPTIVLICPPSDKVASQPDVVAILDQLTTELVGKLKAIPGVYAFGPQAVSTLYPVADYYDAGADAVGKIPYTPKYFAAVGTFLARMALAVRRAPFKVIVLDCDNTLWAGVCGEGGVSAVSVGPGFRAMQEFVANQSSQGKVLCLCSKNVESDVWEIFDHHPQMLLKRGQIVGHRINWSPKSHNLRELASELNLGLDSFIFLDDNPVECAEVRANCPEVLTLQVPNRDQDWPEFLQHVWAFDQLTVTDQDRQRAASYLQNAQREAIRKESAGLDDFLAKLDLQVDIAPPTSVNVPRVAQLTERTNQFNFSTIRRGEAEIIALLNDPRISCDVVNVKDRFGDYGLVGVIITRAEKAALVLDTMLLSCRVLGRGVEHRMLAFIGERARSRGLTTVEIPFIRSKKNQPALDFLNSVALEHRIDTGDGFAYRIPAEAAAAIIAKTISPPPQETEKQTAVVDGDNPPAVVPVVPYQRIVNDFHDIAAIASVIDALPVAVAEPVTANSHVEPQTPRQRQLADIWRNVLKLPSVGIHDDYFALGGTSLLAVRLVLQIEKVFGRHIPIAALLKAPTIEKLTRYLDEPTIEDDLAVVTLRDGGSGTPLLLLPGIGGHVMAFKRLAELLDMDRPVFGMEMRPEIESNRKPRSLETIAGEFIQRILKIQPQGPYLLAGWSFGGLLAFEIARQLQAGGKVVELVAMFDTWRDGVAPAAPAGERFRQHLRQFARRGLSGNLSYFFVTGRAQLGSMHHRFLKLLGLRKTDFFQYESPLTEQMVAVCDAAWRQYKFGKLSGRLVLIKAMRWPDRIGVSYEDPYNAWSGLADTIEVHRVDSDHLGLFVEPAVAQTAAALSKSVQQTAPHPAR
jgi:FkbH-like protein